MIINSQKKSLLIPRRSDTSTSPTASSRSLLLPRDISRENATTRRIRGHITWHLDNRLQFALRATTHPTCLPTQQRRSLVRSRYDRQIKVDGRQLFFSFARTTGSCVRGRPRTLSRRISVSHANYPSCLANGFRGLPENVPADKAQIFRNRRDKIKELPSRDNVTVSSTSRRGFVSVTNENMLNH